MKGQNCPNQPEGEDHGPVIPLQSGDARFGWYCPDQRHDGHRDRRPTRARFTTDEVLRGSIVTVEKAS